jgi:ubiquinone/menaquinone biosynthesis C-methylase UbiE
MKKTWEEFYRKRGRFYLLPHPNFARVISKLNAYKVHSVLDLGCGSGRHSIELARSGFKVKGVDFSDNALKLARDWVEKEGLKATFIKGDFKKGLPFKNGSFDAVLAIDAIFYDTRTSMKFVLEESKRVLRDGGIIFITVPTVMVNPLVTHLILSKEDIRVMVREYFKIIETFLDKSKYYCVFGIKE